MAPRSANMQMHIRQKRANIPWRYVKICQESEERWAIHEPVDANRVTDPQL